MQPDPKRHGLALLAALALGGCATFTDPRASDVSGPPTAELQAAASLSSLLETQQRLVQGGPAEQAEVLAAARQAYEASPQGVAKLRYAIALASPVHPGRDAAMSQRLLREVLATPEMLLPLERSLALIELQRVDAELRMQAEIQRLTAEAERERGRDRNASTVASLNRRLQAEIEENARLHKALEDARAKLEAIATIEQNITERKPVPEGRRQ
jgi:hypothetical protein